MSRWISLVTISISAILGGRSLSREHAGDDACWTYRQSTGELLLDGKVMGKGYSGHGEGLNNGDKESLKDLGPIPRGKWAIGEQFKHDSKGPTVMRLSPTGHKAHGRDGFLIHGDNLKMDMSASNGCIILSKDLRELIAKSSVKRLIVEK